MTATNADRLAALAYVVLGGVLVATRAIGLDNSLWHDEVVAVVQFVREGPGGILSSPDLSHELFGILAWATTSLVGESEVALRIWSVVPFVAGVAVVTAWLHVRLGALAGLTFLFFATASPLLLDISRQARGYGLAFLAMGVLVVAALEAGRTGEARWLVAFSIAGVAGTWTLPQFGIAFVATGAVLILDRQSPCTGGARGGGVRSCDRGLVRTAPRRGTQRVTHRGWGADRARRSARLAVPSRPHAGAHLDRRDRRLGDARVASTRGTRRHSMAYSPLLRERSSALVLSAGVALTLVALFAAQAYVIPRYLSYLLVPLLMLVASGVAAILARVRTRPALIGTLASILLVGLVAASFLAVVVDVLRYPREAYKDAARTIDRATAPETPVLVHVRNPEGLDYYLERPIRVLETDEVPAVVCDSSEGSSWSPSRSASPTSTCRVSDAPASSAFATASTRAVTR